jgi:hypothetical protein
MCLINRFPRTFFGLSFYVVLFWTRRFFNKVYVKHKIQTDITMSIFLFFFVQTARRLLSYNILSTYHNASNHSVFPKSNIQKKMWMNDWSKENLDDRALLVLWSKNNPDKVSKCIIFPRGLVGKLTSLRRCLQTMCPATYSCYKNLHKWD